MSWMALCHKITICNSFLVPWSYTNLLVRSVPHFSSSFLRILCGASTRNAASHKMAMRLAYGATQPCVSNGTPHAVDDTVTTCLRLIYGLRWRLSLLCRLSLSRKHIATESGNFMGFQIALLIYASTSEEVNSKFVELFGKLPVFRGYRSSFFKKGQRSTLLCVFQYKII